MAYSATIGSYKKSMTESLPILQISLAEVYGNAYVDVYKKTHDFTDVAYLTIGTTVTITGASGDLKIIHDGTTLLEQNFLGSGTYCDNALAIPAGQRRLGITQIQLRSTGAPVYTRITNCIINTRIA